MRRAQAGFTLIEITVALVAGLIVAMGIVGLSHEATQTFNEETRSSAAEAAMRTAVDRLRADVARAGYMSTGNILSDPTIAHAPGQTNLQNLTNNGMKGLMGLAALQLIESGSTVDPNVAKLSAAQATGSGGVALTPDVLLIGGNMTCAEEFDVQQINPPTGTCQEIDLSPVSPAIYRVMTEGITSPLASGCSAAGTCGQLENVFAPVTGGGGSAQFMVRLLDDTGHTQYLATCPTGPITGFKGAGSTAYPYVMIDSVDTPILTAAQTQGRGGVSGLSSGKAWINPVQIVRWELTSAPLEAINQPQFAAISNIVQSGQVDANKYDLMRSYVDAFGNVIKATSEIVAEYAVDLDFAFTVDSSLVGPTQPNMISYAFEDPLNVGWAPNVALETSGASPPVNIGAQRIRSVRFRLVTRTALPDRVANVPVPNQFGNEEYLYRYCAPLPGQPVPNCATVDGSLKWARTRTVTTEVALPNNSGNYY
jgi:prepilin-type N-terminal cleavage/methylation domain-containing protein